MQAAKPPIRKRTTFQVGEIGIVQYSAYTRVLGLESVNFNLPTAENSFDLPGTVTLVQETPFEKATHLFENSLAGIERFDLKAAFDSLKTAATALGQDGSHRARGLRALIMLAQARIYALSNAWETALACFQEAARLAVSSHHLEIGEAAGNGIALALYQLAALKEKKAA